MGIAALVETKWSGGRSVYYRNSVGFVLLLKPISARASSADFKSSIGPFSTDAGSEETDISEN